MGKGDKRTRRGKLFAGTYGNKRPRKKVIKTTTEQKVEKQEEKQEEKK